MAHHFTVQQILEYRQCFELYANDRLVTNDAQLRYIMRSIGFAATIAETKAYMSKFDNRVTFPAFLKILHKDGARPDVTREIGAALSTFAGGTMGNSMSRDQLVVLLSSVGEKMTCEEADAILSQLSFHNDRVPIEQLVNQLTRLCAK